MLEQPVRYTSADEDSARWEGFPFRPGDIVISTRSKSGTAWMQMICALLIFQTPEMPAPLGRLSPWPGWLIARAGARSGVLKDPAAFFRRGYSGAGREVLSAAELKRYYARTARLAPPDLLDWLHRESLAGLGRVEPAVAG